MNANPNLPIRPASNFTSITLQAANTPETIFTPAANVNGAIVWDACYTSAGATVAGIALLAKTSAPTTVIDGETIAGGSANGTAGSSNAILRRPRFVAAGKGLYRIPQQADGNAYVFCSYTLL